MKLVLKAVANALFAAQSVCSTYRPTVHFNINGDTMARSCRKIKYFN